MVLIQKNDIVSIQSSDDPFPSSGRVAEVVDSEDLSLYECKLLIDSGSDYMPYWVYVDGQTVAYILTIGEMYQLNAGIHEGELARFSRLLMKAPTALVLLGDGSDYYCPASILKPIKGEAIST